MDIHLENFRCWKGEHKFHIPNGLNLISAGSGSGKTSILLGIFFALYGKGRDLVTFGQTKMKVILKFKVDNISYKIIRTKGPGSLILKYKDDKYINAAAQGIIDKIFGEADNFFVCSYIVQKSDKSFLDLKPSERIELIEKISFTRSDVEMIEEIKKKLKNKIKSLKSELLMKQGASELIEQEKVKKVKKENYPTKEIVLALIKDIPSNVDKELDNILTKRITIENSIKKSALLTIKLGNLKLKDVTPIDFIDNIDELKEDIMIGKNNVKYEQKKKDLEKKIEEYKIKKEIEERSREIIIKDAQKELESIKILNEEEYKKNIKTLASIISLQDKIDEYKTEKIYDTSALKKELDTLKNKLEDLNSRIYLQHCPGCQTPLRIVKNKIIKEVLQPLNGDEVSSINISNSRVKSLTNEIEEKEKNNVISEKNNIMIKEMSNMLINLLNTCPFKDNFKENLLILKDLLKKNVENIEKKKRLEYIIKGYVIPIELIRLEEEIKTLKNDTYTPIKEIDIIKKEEELKHQLILRIQKLKKDEEIKLIKEEIKDIERDLKFNVESLDDIDEQITKLKEKKEIYLKYKNNLPEWEKYLEYYNKLELYKKWKERKDKIEEEEKQILDKLLTHETLLTKILEGESHKIEEFIMNINEHVKIFLEKFFVIPPILEVSSFKQTKKDLVKGHQGKPSINVKIYNNANECKLSSLSGGEFDRCRIAFLLALSSLSNSPFLMLDESVSSLEEELVTEVLEALKSISENKIIMVISHQAIKGEFDNVISLHEK